VKFYCIEGPKSSGQNISFNFHDEVIIVVSKKCESFFIPRINLQQSESCFSFFKETPAFSCDLGILDDSKLSHKNHRLLLLAFIFLSIFLDMFQFVSPRHETRIMMYCLSFITRIITGNLVRWRSIYEKFCNDFYKSLYVTNFNKYIFCFV
jgi:hypothetical protein